MNHTAYIVRWLRSFAEEEAKLYGLTDHLETSDHNASVAADIIELQQHRIVEFQAKVVMEFSHTDIPEFSQGFDPAEVLDVVTAERCASLVASIETCGWRPRESCKYSCGDFCLAESLQTRVNELEAQLAAKGEPVAKVNAARLENALPDEIINAINALTQTYIKENGK